MVQEFVCIAGFRPGRRVTEAFGESNLTAIERPVRAIHWRSLTRTQDARSSNDPNFQFRTEVSD